LSEKADKRKCIAAVRVRGSISAQREARATLDMLRLGRTNHAVWLIIVQRFWAC
jgi:hypothetical protein